MLGLALLLLVVASCHRTRGPEQGYHPYGIRHATLHFEYFGPARGTEDLYIDSFGILEARIVHSDFEGEKDVKTRIVYTVKNRAMVTIIDSEKRTEMRIKDHKLDSMYHLDPSDVPSPEQIFHDYFEKLGYHYLSDTIVAGLHAKKWQQRDEPAYVIESDGLIIGNQMGPIGLGVELRLISIDTVSPIDPSRFDPRSGFPVRSIVSGGSPQGQPQQ